MYVVRSYIALASKCTCLYTVAIGHVTSALTMNIVVIAYTCTLTMASLRRSARLEAVVKDSHTSTNRDHAHPSSGKASFFSRFIQKYRRVSTLSVVSTRITYLLRYL